MDKTEKEFTKSQNEEAIAAFKKIKTVIDKEQSSLPKENAEVMNLHRNVNESIALRRMNMLDEIKQSTPV